ncbi:hypothetical protein GQX73_g2403 [Xylaria multiplex]|uniref:Nudix hydrolase domain-containing protein n=1 Tax=Xylaria multiplex TaxID=323545 RepID=A0A7C8NB82_9PEZI|nr:hypothetical protein GQX73_g2403 [Xylaria multiplex]
MTSMCAEESRSAKDSQGHVPTTFTISPKIVDFHISPVDFLASRPDIHNIVAGTMVFRPGSITSPSTSNPEVLLLRRAASDSFPLKWEIPAGTADPSIDRSIIGIAVRELWEETHLRARRLHQTVGLGTPSDALHLTSSVGEVQDARMDSEYSICLLRVAGLTWAIVAFLTEVEDELSEIVLREDEHVDWAWLTENEVETGFFRDRPGKSLDMVSEAMKIMVLEGFRLMKEIAHE